MEIENEKMKRIQGKFIELERKLEIELDTQERSRMLNEYAALLLSIVLLFTVKMTPTNRINLPQLY